MADSLLDVLTKGSHSRTLQELEMVRRLPKSRVIYYWLSALVTGCYETTGVTTVTAGQPSLERQPGLGVDRGGRTMNGNKEASSQGLQGPEDHLYLPILRT